MCKFKTMGALLQERVSAEKAEGSVVVSAALQGYMQHAAEVKAVAVQQQQKSLACWLTMAKTNLLYLKNVGAQVAMDFT